MLYQGTLPVIFKVDEFFYSIGVHFKVLTWLVGLGLIRVGLGIKFGSCWENGAYGHVVVYNYWMEFWRVLKDGSNSSRHWSPPITLCSQCQWSDKAF